METEESSVRTLRRENGRLQEQLRSSEQLNTTLRSELDLHRSLLTHTQTQTQTQARADAHTPTQEQTQAQTETGTQSDGSNRTINTGNTLLEILFLSYSAF